MVLGIDIGGTGVKLGIVDEHHRVIERTAIPTGANRSSYVLLNDIIDAARPLCKAHQPTAVGIGSAGRIDSQKGIVLRAGHLPFVNEPVAAIIGEALGLPATLDNDANCALLAESTCGAAKNFRHALMVTIGTGIGGAIMIDGTIYRGRNGRAGECGHFVFDKSGPLCVCGLRGCFEQYASASTLLNMAVESALRAKDSLLNRCLQKDCSAKAVFKAAAYDCPIATRVLHDYGEQLALGLNSLIKLYDPDGIVLAGGITGAGNALLDVITPHLFAEATVLLSALGGDAGLIGAALLTVS